MKHIYVIIDKFDDMFNQLEVAYTNESTCKAEVEKLNKKYGPRHSFEYERVLLEDY